MINGDLTNNNNSDQVVIDGKIIIDGDFYGGNGSTIEGGGKFEITGSITTDGTATVFGSTDDCDGTLTDCSRDASGLLPVELISFNAVILNGVVELKWATATETNNSFFTIEKSFDLYTYEVIGKIEGAGNSNFVNQYVFEDKLADTGHIYYRLTQTDYDGTTVICGIIGVETDLSNSKNTMIDIYPNPVIDYVEIEIERSSEEIATVILLSQDGQIIYQEKSASEISSDIQIQMQELPSAIYIVKVEVGNEVIKKKLVKM